MRQTQFYCKKIINIKYNNNTNNNNIKININFLYLIASIYINFALYNQSPVQYTTQKTT